MKQVKYDKDTAKAEKAAQELEKVEEEKRQKYLNRLKGDKNFQRYVVEEIIQFHANELTDMRNLEKLKLDLGNKQEIGEVVVLAIMARKQLEKMLEPLR